MGSPQNSSRVDQASVLELHQACRVYTAMGVAAGLLDAIGWREDCALEGQRLLEPCAGSGVFVRLATERLIASLRRNGRPLTARLLKTAIVAYEVHPGARQEARRAVSEALIQGGVAGRKACQLAANWIREGDFLAATELGSFTHVVGNPPYIRWSKIPGAFRELYSRLVPEVMQKGNLCVPFLYKGASVLKPGGRLAFVCSDRWLRAEYASGLREHLSLTLRTVAHIEIYELPVFDRNVHSYAAVTIFERPADPDRGGSASRTLFAQPANLAQLDRCFRRVVDGSEKSAMMTIEEPLGSRPTITMGNRSKVRTIRNIEVQMPTIEESGCCIRVGAALGHTPAFVIDRCDCAVERRLLLPYATSRDVQNFQIRTNRWVINVFDERGNLIDLTLYPGARRHLLRFKSTLMQRSCVRRPEHWFKTIDKISRSFAVSPKILICGIARTPRLALATEIVQPGNSLYSITSSEWPLPALYNVLSSGVLGIFADAYSIKVNGAFLRFHRVVLRRLRLPLWPSVPAELKQLLAVPDSVGSLRKAVAQLYKVSETLLDDYAACGSVAN